MTIILESMRDRGALVIGDLRGKKGYSGFAAFLARPQKSRRLYRGQDL